MKWNSKLKTLLVCSVFEKAICQLPFPGTNNSPLILIPHFPWDLQPGLEALLALRYAAHCCPGVLHLSKDSENTRPSLHPASGNDCELCRFPERLLRPLVIRSNVSEMLPLLHTNLKHLCWYLPCLLSSCLACTHHCHRNRPVPYKIKISFFFIKTLSSYRAWESPISFMNASERLYPFVTAASLRFLQGLLFCAMINNCSTVFCLNAWGCTVSHEQETSYSIATTHWDEASRLGKKRQTFKQPLLQFHIKMTSFKDGPAREKHMHFKTQATVSLWSGVCILTTSDAPMKTSRSIKPIISGTV